MDDSAWDAAALVWNTYNGAISMETLYHNASLLMLKGLKYHPNPGIYKARLVDALKEMGRTGRLEEPNDL